MRKEVKNEIKFGKCYHQGKLLLLSSCKSLNNDKPCTQGLYELIVL